MNAIPKINDELLNQIVKALNEGKNFSFSKNGLNIQANMQDGALRFNCTYKPTEDKAELLRKDFYDFCNNLNEDLYLKTCESISDLAALSKEIDTGNETQVRNGISIFKNALKVTITNEVRLINEKIEKEEAVMTAAHNEINELLNKRALILKSLQ